jgi:hypothetical protein
MKVDIEGSDAVCLNSLRVFSLKPSYVSIESEKLVLRILEREISQLQGLGYTHFKAIEQSGMVHQVAPMPAREGAYAPHAFPSGSSGLFGRELPGSWKNRQQILREYRRIFILYRLLGNYSLVGRSPAGRAILRYLSVALRKPLPGWYDTHARYRSAA